MAKKRRSVRGSSARKVGRTRAGLQKRLPAKVTKPVARRAAKSTRTAKTAHARRKPASAAKPRVTKRAGAKFIYFFGSGKADGNKGMRDLLGGKGANLAEMTNAGLPVPPGFTITTEACRQYYATGRQTPAPVDAEMLTNVKKLERAAGAALGSTKNPLLVSVRSGAKFSMPGMMDTILNLGLNDESVEGLRAQTGNGRFAYDSYRRFIQMFGNVVLEISKEAFEHELDAVKAASGVQLDTGLNEAALKEVVERYKGVIRKKTRQAFPQDPAVQLRMARDAVFRSWNTPRAIEYRRIYEIPDDIGTAVNVQAMVFGNTGERSATGVGFTRNPASGAREFFGEFLVNAQGEDVVAGIRTPQPIAALEKVMPKAYKELRQITARLEKHYQDVQDFEFTIQDEKLYMLQTRSGKRTGYAAVVIATDMVREKLISARDAVLRVEPEAVSQLLAPVFDPAEWKKLSVATKGLPASPGAASGQVVFTAEEAEAGATAGKRVLLVRKETAPDDIRGMYLAQGVLTATGGMTSHAAVVGRQMGKPSVVGAGDIRINEINKTFTVNGHVVRAGDWVSFDGLTGEVKLGQVATTPSDILRVVSGDLKPEQSDIYQRFRQILAWADKFRSIGIRANADQPDQAELAYAFGARGIGLCRTEHMFFGEKRLPLVQRMILAESEVDRRKALDGLLPMQRDDFYGVFKAMHECPVTIRLIDPPLHEFLPKREDLMVEIAKLETAGGPSRELEKKRELLARVEQLHEFNPMLGHRGVRLAITYPEIAEMQVRAVFQAACQLKKEGYKTVPEVMVPLVGDVRELRDQKAIIDRVAAEVMAEQGVKVKYLVGTMIEVPRGALTADEVAAEAQFFSFGTNDLTQMTYGFSRDDIGKFLAIYQAKKILERDPFQSLDATGVGQLVEIAARKGRAARQDLKLGVCGEHGGDPSSIHFFQKVGVDYVSMSPYRVPVARLAAAQAALQVKVGD